MRDTVFILFILLFWGITAYVFTFIINDPFLATGGFISTEGIYTINTTQINASEGLGSSQSIDQANFWSTLGRLFTFRLPEDIFPPSVNAFMSLLNLVLAVMLGLLVYRQARSGSG